MAHFGLNIKHYGSNENLIIFAHGLFGSSESWDNQYGESILNLLFGNDDIKENYALATFDYASNKSKQFYALFSKDTLTINQLAIALKAELNSKNPRYKNIVVIGHSMGGLILKKYLCDNLNDNRVKIYISIATPHFGSDLAKLAGLIPLLNKVQIADLKPNSKYLLDLNENWISNQKKLPTSYYMYGLNDNIVNDKSAVANSLVDDKYIMGFMQDHLSITEVTNQDPLLECLVAILTECTQTINKKILFINNTKKRLSEEIPIKDYDDYSVKYSLLNDNSIFKWKDDVASELKSEKRFKEFLKEYTKFLTKIAKQAEEIIYTGIPLIPLIFLDGFHFKHIKEQTNLVFYRKENEWQELTKELKMDQYYQTPIDEIENCKEINICLTSTFSSFAGNKNKIEKVNNHQTIEYTAENIHQDSITSCHQVNDIANKFMKYIRELKDTKDVSKVHLFSAIPVPLAYYIGTKIETHDPDIIIYNYENDTYPWGINIQKGTLVITDFEK